MTHNEKRYSTLREGQIALFTGCIYGSVHTITGHPLDTIKSNMQLEPKFKGMSALKVANGIFKEYGIKGFFRGCVPPLLGSAMYRGVMMSAYEASFTYFDLNFAKDSWVNTEIAGIEFLNLLLFSFMCYYSLLGCLRPVVPISVVIASGLRGMIEGKI